MRNVNYFLLGILFLQACGMSKNSDKQEIVQGRQVIFNGKDIRGWEQKGDFKWEIENDALFLIAENEEESFLYSEKEYRDFVLEAEFLAPQIKSGIGFRYNESSPASLDKAGYLVSLNWNNDQQNPMGSIFHTARATIIDSAKTEDWQKIKIEALEDHFKVFINDNLICETHDRKREAGKIALLAPGEEGQVIGFRELILEEFPSKDSLRPMMEDEYRQSPKAELEPLFVDDSFEGWNPVGDGSWRINQGIIHGFSGAEGGFLVSDKTYKNFYLKLSFKIKKEDNSGIFIRKSPTRSDVSIEDALECNIYDHNGYSHPYSTGSIVNQARAWYGMIDYTAWNDLEIFAKDEHVVMFINGRKSSDTYVATTFDKPGNICLQAGIQVFAKDKGPSDIYFKDVMIKNMDGI